MKSPIVDSPEHPAIGVARAEGYEAGILALARHCSLTTLAMAQHEIQQAAHHLIRVAPKSRPKT